MGNWKGEVEGRSGKGGVEEEGWKGGGEGNE